MTINVPPRFRDAVDDVRSRLAGGERMLFEILCASAVLGYQLPQDDINFRALRGRRSPRPALSRALREIVGDNDGALSEREWTAAGRRLATRLARTLGARDLTARDAEGNFEPLRTLLSFAPSAIALDCRVPTDPLLRIAWATIIRTFGAVHPSRVAPIELPFLDRRRLSVLLGEARRESRPDRDASGATPGPSGRRLAVDPRLVLAVEKALGERLEPAFIARYVFYSREGDYFWPHTDSLLVHVNVFLCLEHQPPSNGALPSAFIGYRADGSCERYELQAGEAVAAHTQGLVHAREPLRPGESVTLLAIALQPRARRRPARRP